MLLRDKVIVVTGAGHGIGEAFAHRFTAEGAKVVVSDIEADAVRRVADATGGVGWAGDITDNRTVMQVAAAARDAYGRIDVWFTNAGVAGPARPGVLPDDDAWQHMWNLHVMAHVHAAREVLPEMVGRGEGYLIQTVSTVALSTQPDKAPYAVTKHAALALGEWLALHYRPRGVRVSCFCPGPMMTRMLRANDFPPGHRVLAEALSPEQAADVVVEGMGAERFLIVTESSGVDAMAAKTDDYDSWIDAQTARRVRGG